MPNFILVKAASLTDEDAESCLGVLKFRFAATATLFKDIPSSSKASDGEKAALKVADAAFLFLPPNANLSSEIGKVATMRSKGLSSDVPIFIVLAKAVSEKNVENFITNNLTTQAAATSSGQPITLYQLKASTEKITKKTQIPAKKTVQSSASQPIWIHGVWDFGKDEQIFNEFGLSESEIKERKGRVVIKYTKPESTNSVSQKEISDSPKSQTKKLAGKTSIDLDVVVDPIDEKPHKKLPTETKSRQPSSTTEQKLGKSSKGEIIITLPSPVPSPFLSPTASKRVTPKNSKNFGSAVNENPKKTTELPREKSSSLPTVSLARNWNIWTAALCGLGGILLTCIVLYVLQSLALLQVMAFISGLIAGTVLVALPPLGVLLMGLTQGCPMLE